MGLGWLYLTSGTTADYDAGVKAFLTAMDDNNPDGIFGLGYAMWVGRGTPRNVTSARRHFDTAAEDGVGGAMVRACGVKRRGRQCGLSEYDAVRGACCGDGIRLSLPRLGCKRPSSCCVHGCCKLPFIDWCCRRLQAYKAMACSVCDPPSADRDKIARRALSRGLATQDPVSLYIMGLFHLRGLAGMSVNPVEARGWFLRAAEKNHRTALYQLGTLAEAGVASAVDLAAAERFYRRGAELGSDNAATALGRFLLARKAGQKVDEEAAMFLERAGQQGGCECL